MRLVVRRAADARGPGGDQRPCPHGPRPAATGRRAAPLDLDPQQALAELEEEGIVLRDPVRGLVDFPCLHPGGRVVQLCWQLGEEDLAWWHLPEDGFAGRRPSAPSSDPCGPP